MMFAKFYMFFLMFFVCLFFKMFFLIFNFLICLYIQEGRKEMLYLTLHSTHFI